MAQKAPDTGIDPFAVTEQKDSRTQAQQRATEAAGARGASPASERPSAGLGLVCAPHRSLETRKRRRSADVGGLAPSVPALPLYLTLQSSM